MTTESRSQGMASLGNSGAGAPPGVHARRFTTADGASIYFETIGMESRKPVVVCLNGTGQSTFNWRPLARQLQSHFGVLLYDARTQGQSRMGAQPPGLETHAMDLIALLGHLALDGVHLVGFSHGAMVALASAAKELDGLKTLTLCSLSDATAPQVSIALKAWREVLRRGGRAALGWIWLATLFGDDFLARNRAIIAKIVNGIVRRNQKVALLSHLEAMGRYPSPERYLRRIRCPVLFLTGGRDPLVNPDQTVRWAAGCGGIHHHFPAMGHTLPLEAPDLFVAELTAFWEVSRSGL